MASNCTNNLARKLLNGGNWSDVRRFTKNFGECVVLRIQGIDVLLVDMPNIYFSGMCIFVVFGKGIWG